MGERALDVEFGEAPVELGAVLGISSYAAAELIGMRSGCGTGSR